VATGNADSADNADSAVNAGSAGDKSFRDLWTDLSSWRRGSWDSAPAASPPRSRRCRRCRRCRHYRRCRRYQKSELFGFSTLQLGCGRRSGYIGLEIALWLWR